MTNGMIWLKHYSSKRTDPRVKLLSLPSKAVYYLLTEVAAQCDAGGAFTMNSIELTEKQLAHLATIELAELKTAMREMKRTGLMSVNGHGPYLTDFSEEQTSQEQRRQQWKDSKKRIRNDVPQDVQQDTKQEVPQDVPALELRVKSLELRVSSLLSPDELQKVKPGWITEAAAIAEKAGKPATYAKGIIKNWIKEGKNNDTANTRNNRRQTQKPKPAVTAPTSTDLDAARRALAKRKAKTSV